MENETLINKEKIDFEVLETKKNSVIFKRKISPKGRSKKDVHKIEMDLPKATIHYFDMEDYIKLKKIEKEILENQIVKKEQRSFVHYLFHFLEINR